jgi:hypothetical protein
MSGWVARILEAVYDGAVEVFVFSSFCKYGYAKSKVIGSF